MAGSTPRRTVEPSYAAQLAKEIRDLRIAVSALERGATLRNAAISGGDGLKVYGPDGALRISLNTSDGAVVAYDGNEQAVARYGPLDESAPGEYGVEILVNGTWVRLGYQTTTWDQIAGKPATYAPTPHTHLGTAITSAVANATNAGHADTATSATSAANATNATKAAQADGSQYGFSNNVAGSTFYALWVGNDGGYHFGRNTSSKKYKENVRDVALKPDGVLNLRPVVYDRKPKLKFPEDENGNRLIGPPQRIEGAKNEFGLIAEEVYEHVPEIITFFEGEIDGIRYDLLGVALLPVVQRHEGEIAELKSENAELKAQLAALTTAVRTLGGNV